jgi:hypothetical protein
LKTMNIIKNIAVVLLAFLVFTGCDDEDFTGNSSLTPTTGATISVSGLPSSAPNFLEMDTTFTFTVTLSEAQVVDVPVYISQSAGDASLGADFTIDNNNSRVVIPAFSTSGTVTISVLGDTEPEGTETFTIQIGDERTDNATITPVEVTFTIGNVVSEDLSMNLEWATAAVFDASGAELGATDVGDLTFNLLAADTLYSQADGASFESLGLSGSAPNGTYDIAVGIWGFIDLGDVDAGPYSFDLSVTSNQGGVGSAGSLAATGALSTDNCLDDYVIVGSVTKAGSTYTISEGYQEFFAADNPQDFIGGNYSEVHDDGTPQTSAVTISTPDADGVFTITNFAFSSAWWCGSADATIDLVVTEGQIFFPNGTGAESAQAPGNLDAICGYDGPSIELNSVGTWDPCSGVIQMDIAIRVALGTFSGSSIMTYTPE